MRLEALVAERREGARVIFHHHWNGCVRGALDGTGDHADDDQDRCCGRQRGVDGADDAEAEL
jgi:hypothetical protein